MYRPRTTFTKTAILVPVADPETMLTIRAPFGTEIMKGEFYIVASPSGSYGAAKKEFEADHIEVAPSQWQKQVSVMAYQATERCRVETRLADGTEEASVIADPGDWIVRHPAGEVTVALPDDFAERYEPSE